MSWFAVGAAAVSAYSSYSQQESANRAAEANATIRNAQNDYEREMQELNNQMVDVNTKKQWNMLTLQEMMSGEQQMKQEMQIEQEATSQLAQLQTVQNFSGMVGNTVQRSYTAIEANQENARRASREQLEMDKLSIRDAREDLLMQNLSAKQNNLIIDANPDTSINWGQVVGSAAQSYFGASINQGGFGSGGSGEQQPRSGQASTYNTTAWNTTDGSKNPTYGL